METVIHELQPRGAFRIARKRTAPFANVIVRIERDGIAGWGEASPNPFYAEDAAGVQRKIHDASTRLRDLPLRDSGDIESAWRELWPVLAPSRAAQCAIDLALWDWLARREQTTVCELALGQQPRDVISFATIGLGSPDEFREKLAHLHGFPRIKIKSDQQADLSPVEQVRDALGTEIAVDANCAWEPRTLPQLAERCAALGVRFIEQPFGPDLNALLTRGSCALPILADESCVTEEQVPPLAQHFDGINVKLVKCGGLTPALRMLRAARELGLKTMVGCMLETSVLIAAGCVAAQLADYADLDGAWLLAEDPCSGWIFDRGILHPPSDHGLGATPR